jgi:LuxR family maltose regulon positive regulatory protein
MQVALPSVSFALAKIQPPRPRMGLVERPELERALAQALQQQRLTVLLAPAGYGKTSALTRQIRQLPEGCVLAWVSADEDDQLQRFLACLTTALEPFDLPWRVAPDALATLAQGERGLRDVASELVNALAAADVPRGLIVIDDAHRLTDPHVFELLQALLERLPPQWGLVIASRVEPPLHLARLRAEGELAEFRQYELRFSEAEVAALLASSGRAEGGPTARELLERTDGWAAGLRLSLSARAPASAGAVSQRHLFDYLATEVLAEMPDELRHFLLRCSVLPELCAARCLHVSGMPQAAQLLEEVERRGLFVSVMDADELTLRLHDLFRDFLEDRLQREQPGELPGLLRRAAEHETDLSRAVGYLTRAGDWDGAARVLVQRAQEQLSVGAGATLEQLLTLFPANEFEPRPDLHLVRGLAAWPRFDWATLLVHMQRAAEGYASAGRARDAVLARTNVCSGLHHAGRLPEATQELRRLCALPLDDAARAFVCYTATWDAFANARAEEAAPAYGEMLVSLERMPVPALWLQFPIHCVFVGLPGMRPLLERFVHGATRVCGDAPSQLRAGVMHMRAWLALGAGRPDDAERWIAQAEEDSHWLGNPRIVHTQHRMAKLLLHALRGAREAAYAVAREIVDDLRQHSPLSHRRVHETELLFIHARAAWLLDDAAVLREIDTALQQAANPNEWVPAPANRALVRACLALMEGRADEARSLLQPLADDVNRSLFYPATQARMMLADLQLQQGDLDAAAATLRPWFDESAQAEPGGALLAGPRVLQRLASARWGQRLAPGEQAVLRSLAGLLAPASAETAVAVSAGDTVSLSEREREVLERIAAGDSNKLIARVFDLSPHTVKRHVANILGKLGVESRGQAASRWRELQGR